MDLVEGVDEMVEPLSPEEQTKIQLATQLSAAGWGQQMGRFLWQQGSTSELRPSELIPHHTGLPSFDLCVAPAKATGNGSFALFISGQGVFGASLGDPPTKHQWHITQSLPHDSASQLLACLEHLSEKAFD